MLHSSSYTFNVQGTGGIAPLNVASSSGSSLLTVLGNGNVGIGTSTPFANLQINGSSPTLMMTDTSQTGPAGQYIFDNTSDALNVYRGVLGVTATDKFQIANTQNITNSIGVQTISAGNFAGTNLTYFPTSGSSYINNGGNVGIGTTTPVSLTNNTSLSLYGTWTSSVNFGGNGAPNTSQIGSDGGGNMILGTLANGGGQNLYLQTSSTTRVAINGSGFVGIGTTTPNAPLDVVNDNGVVFESQTNSNTSGNYTATIRDSRYGGGGTSTATLNFDQGSTSGNVTYSQLQSAVQINTGGGASGSFVINTLSGGALATRIAVNSSGNVGIGNSSPTQLLTVGTATPVTIFRSATLMLLP